MSELELWAGAECTINRIGDRYFDQSRRTGHHERLDDIDRLAQLGVKRVRFPVLWEAVAPHGLDQADFTWHDARLSRLCALGIEPIVGLVHHGSGPRYAPIDSPRFVQELPRFAELVARRYPFVTSFTPVNEPLTTARFSGLYGHWYPHGRDTATFLRILLNEIHATAAAMRAIRATTPSAQLVQTEDAGRTYGTPRLAKQCEYENDRRWLTFDLLTGRVTRKHPLREHLEDHGISATELDALCAQPCPPDIVGLNYYVTSDRFIDDRIELYPASTHGGNAFLAYADVEAVRVRGRGIAGHPQVLREAWQRYRLPVALTEVHLGCAREEQLRWLAEAWDAAKSARERAVDVRAITLWSAFGATDWSSLLTSERGHYESGAYDARGGVPRPTALCEMARSLAQGVATRHPLLAQPGWWRRSERILYPAKTRVSARPAVRGSAPLLGVGCGLLSDALVPYAAQRGMPIQRVARVGAALAALCALRPWAVVIELEQGTAYAARMRALVRLALACARARVPVVFFSSDRVFDGGANEPYGESDAAAPRCERGLLHHGCERVLRGFAEHALVVRTGPLLDARSASDSVGQLLRHSGHDDIVSPAFVPHVLEAVVDLLVDREQGVWHLTGNGHARVREIAHRVGHAGPTHTPNEPSLARSMHALRSERAALLPSLDATLEAYAAASPAAPARSDARPTLRLITSDRPRDFHDHRFIER